MNTALIEGKNLSRFDPMIVATLKLNCANVETVRKAPKLIGIRNEQGEIYRVIGAHDMNQFLEAFVQLSDLCLDAQIYVSNCSTEEYYDAIFSTIWKIQSPNCSL